MVACAAGRAKGSLDGVLPSVDRSLDDAGSRAAGRLGSVHLHHAAAGHRSLDANDTGTAGADSRHRAGERAVVGIRGGERGGQVGRGMTLFGGSRGSGPRPGDVVDRRPRRRQGCGGKKAAATMLTDAVRVNLRSMSPYSWAQRHYACGAGESGGRGRPRSGRAPVPLALKQMGRASGFFLRGQASSCEGRRDPAVSSRTGSCAARRESTIP